MFHTAHELDVQIFTESADLKIFPFPWKTDGSLSNKKNLTVARESRPFLKCGD